MSYLQTFQVVPSIPDSLSFLEVLARNIWWCWHYDAVELFRRIDLKLWDKSGRNPLLFLTYLSQERLNELAKDNSFLSHLNRIKASYDRRLTAECRRDDRSSFGVHQYFGVNWRSVIAYFSMEFGIHESIPLFAGGLGVLAGDHLKASSDMGLPLVGVGLLYHHGYFRQYLNPDGWQQEEYPETDIYYLPIEKAKDADGKEVIVTVSGPDGEIRIQVWQMRIGRIPLYLLDTNLQENSAYIREITSKLYAGDAKLRVAQEMVLGIGGMRALFQMGIHPTVCHLNEGHSAFANLERLAQIMAVHRVDLRTAMEIIPRTTIFTTHTPVAAGNEDFPVHLVRPYFTHLKERLGVSEEEMISWAQPPGSGPHAPISMFVLGTRMAQYCNGVSRLHGKVSRRIWSHIWPEIPEDEIPITHVTNGVHIPSWLSYENALLFERYIGPDWYIHPSAPENVARINDIYAEELWRAHSMSRSRLIRTCRELMVKQYKRRNAPNAVLKEAESVLDQDILTISFSRRFATYKRAHLLFHDPDRLERIITSEDYPVQFIFAGKAHPRDNEGKDLIRKVVQFARKPSIRHRMIFIEDYDIHLARHLVHGSDVWLNTPRRPCEACGTSGMKAAVNGVLNVSVLDGWWDEGYGQNRGWKIGDGEEYPDQGYQDAIESQALYNILENEVIPCFYERENGDVPKRWLSMMKESMKMGMRVFCSHRMVVEYDNRFYLPAARRMQELIANNSELAKTLADQHERLRECWKDIHIQPPISELKSQLRVGEQFRVTTVVNLGSLRPDEVEVELYHGMLKTVDSLGTSRPEPMQMIEQRGDGSYLYECTLTCRASGRFGFTVRVLPKGDLWTKFRPGFIKWA